jgi:hypothetical protein
MISCSLNVRQAFCSSFTLLMSVDGFYLDSNQSEALYLDDIIFQDLNPSLQEELNLQQYYG